MNNNKTIAIIGAMDCEITKIKEIMQNIQEIEDKSFTLTTGTYNNLNIILAKSGVGKVNSAVCTQYICDKYSPDYIINTGVAGGIAKGLKIGNIVAGEKLVQYDFDVTALGYAKGYMCTGINKDKPTFYFSDKELLNAFIEAMKNRPEATVHKGIIATADMFLSDLDKKEQLRTEFNATAAEMEGAAIAQTATRNNIPFLIIRAVSDLADGETDDYVEFSEERMAHYSSEAIKTFLKTL